MEQCGWILGDIVKGLQDSLSFHQLIPIILTSTKIQHRLLQCFFLNVCILIGGMLISKMVLNPFLTFLLAVRDTKDMGPQTVVRIQAVSSILSGSLQLVYKLMLIYPVLCISLLLNRVWYTDICNESAKHPTVIRKLRYSSPPTATYASVIHRIIGVISDEIYRGILPLGVWIQSILLAYIPYIGIWCALVQIAWVYSFYIFEYKWAIQRQRLLNRLQFFETNWAYFLGFGIPTAALTCLLPRDIEIGLFAYLFPLFAMLALLVDESVQYNLWTTCPADRVKLTNLPNIKLTTTTTSTTTTKDATTYTQILVKEEEIHPKAPYFSIPMFRFARFINWVLLSFVKLIRRYFCK